MINKYYLQELKRLREIGAEFSKENPSIAPMLEEPASDPDVERLLEGVAFLTGAVREKMEDEFPEIIHDLLRQIWPQALRPLPSATLVSFTPGEKISQSTRIPAGMAMESLPVDGTPCTFITCSNLTIHPLSVSNVSYEEPGGRNPLIRVSLKLSSGTAGAFRPKRLSLHLGGAYNEASDLYLRLTRDVKEIRIRAEGEETACYLSPDHVIPMGFSKEEAMIPWPTNAFDGYRQIQEYFLMPEKFLFIDIMGWEKWTSRSESRTFHLEFVLNSLNHGLERPDKKSVVLNTVPAVNIFPHQAVPVIADHMKTDYPVRPGGELGGKYQVFSVEKVEGHVHGRGTPLEFKPFHSFSAGDVTHVYHEKLSNNPVREGMNVSVSLAYPPDKGVPELKYLSFDIICTNGFLAEALVEGDICIPSQSTPESVTFRNIRKPTSAGLPPLGTESLWQLTSLLTLNHVSLAQEQNLKALLKLFLLDRRRDKKHRMINDRKIQGIKAVNAETVDRLIKGTLMRGTDIRLSISQSHFSGPGDVFLFGSVLDRFMGMYASINTFTRLIINETDSGETWTWPERMGDQALM